NAVARQIGAGKDAEHTGHRLGRGGIDGSECGMCMRGAQHYRMRLARPIDVVEIVAVPGQKTPILDPTDRLTDAELLHKRLRACCTINIGSPMAGVYPPGLREFRD